MATLTFSPRAEDDLRSIADYIAQDDPGRAVTFVLELRDLCLSLREFPRRFRRALRFGPDAHRCVHGNYVIIYEVRGEAIDILAIVHGARDLDGLLD